AAIQAMPDIVTILRRTLTADGNGGQTQSYGSVGTTTCRLSFYSGDKPIMFDAANAEKIDPRERYVVTLPFSASILETDRLTINSVTYEIVSALNVRSYETARRLLVKRV